RNGGEVRRGPVDRHEESRAEADVGVIRYDGQLLPGGGEEVQGLANGGPAVGLEGVRAGVGDAVTEHRGHNGLARVAVAEVDDAVVVTHHLHVAVVVRVVEGEQLGDGARPQRVEVPAPQRRA